MLSLKIYTSFYLADRRIKLLTFISISSQSPPNQACQPLGLLIQNFAKAMMNKKISKNIDLPKIEVVLPVEFSMLNFEIETFSNITLITSKYRIEGEEQHTIFSVVTLQRIYPLGKKATGD